MKKVDIVVLNVGVGSYHGDMAEAKTHETHLNVFEHFNPKVPAGMEKPKITFCANLHPSLQNQVIEQTKPTRCTILDSMNLWIDIASKELLDVMKKVDIVVLNDGEIKLLADDSNLVRAGNKSTWDDERYSHHQKRRAWCTCNTP